MFYCLPTGSRSFMSDSYLALTVGKQRHEDGHEP